MEFKELEERSKETRAIEMKKLELEGTLKPGPVSVERGRGMTGKLWPNSQNYNRCKAAKTTRTVTFSGSNCLQEATAGKKKAGPLHLVHY